TQPVDHILCGFLHERGSGGAYIWRYALPLYDRREFISLEFGDRLPYPQGFIQDERRTAKDEAVEFVRRIEPYEAATYAWRNIQGFMANVEFWRSLQSPWVRRAYAMTHIMLGRRAEAQEQLEILSRESGIEDYPHFREDIERISGDLSSGIERAQNTLL